MADPLECCAEVCAMPQHGRLSLQDWTRVRSFLNDLTDPEMFGWAVTAEVRRQALTLLAAFGG